MNEVREEETQLLHIFQESALTSQFWVSRKGHHHFHSDGQWSLVFKEGAEESVVVSLNSQKCLNALCTLSSIGIFKSLCSFWFFSGIFPSNV